MDAYDFGKKGLGTAGPNDYAGNSGSSENTAENISKQLKGLGSYLQYVPPKKYCPNCGYCPTCGRRNDFPSRPFWEYRPEYTPMYFAGSN